MTQMMYKLPNKPPKWFVGLSIASMTLLIIYLLADSPKGLFAMVMFCILLYAVIEYTTFED